MYYRLLDDDDFYDDPGHISDYPSLPDGACFGMGRRIDQPLQEPLDFKMDPEWGEDMMLIMGVRVLLMHNSLVNFLLQNGVENLQTGSQTGSGLAIAYRLDSRTLHYKT
ncbi:MAG: hypothetical protein OEZ39_00800 [Gammaproteobacteria bacterium]|nr:hypothetical protein [Gammaproteobacteria bacterium]MDH5650388.1 hypothetical protein [Gammaproteobacteria bacterium]